MAWALFYLFDAMRPSLPWATCGNWWNTQRCISFQEQITLGNLASLQGSGGDVGNETRSLLLSKGLKFHNLTGNLTQLREQLHSSTEEYF
ncbi:unnamed protein product [Protopolystoma xenopodis]|uniref:Uncharacterized protein n=1 Tax=Protopolystoma xenopodis TaxID=117903 RepID=A0A448XMV4_9PLAT|nr:unnamed protein product [Protopolystoma xenopodis]